MGLKNLFWLLGQVSRGKSERYRELCWQNDSIDGRLTCTSFPLTSFHQVETSSLPPPCSMGLRQSSHTITPAWTSTLPGSSTANPKSPRVFLFEGGLARSSVNYRASHSPELRNSDKAYGQLTHQDSRTAVVGVMTSCYYKTWGFKLPLQKAPASSILCPWQ